MFRRGGRVAEGAALEMLYTGNCIEGSNPSSSALALYEFGSGWDGRCPFVAATDKLGRGKSEHHRAASRLTAGRVHQIGNDCWARRQVQQRTDSLTYTPFGAWRVAMVKRCGKGAPASVVTRSARQTPRGARPNMEVSEGCSSESRFGGRISG
jgi:hypothetical protein